MKGVDRYGSVVLVCVVYWAMGLVYDACKSEWNTSSLYIQRMCNDGVFL